MIKEFSRLRKDDSNYERFKENKLFFRTRGLDRLQERFEEDILTHIKNLSKNQKEVRILEIGFGEGKALLESMSLGNNILGYGVNDKKRSTLSNVDDIMHNAKAFNIKTYHKPKIFFYDAGLGLKFKDDYFDIIFSQVAIHYVGNKAKLFEEIWRILKKGGKAFLHFDSKLEGKHPDFMYIYKDTPRFVVYDKNSKITSTKKLFDKLKNKGFDIECLIQKKDYKSMVLVMNKNTKKHLNLGLEYDGNSTIYLTQLKNTDKYKFDTGIWWGTRSVYNMK
ncbi:MAG: methyltransferase domain-containing protein [Candidatus Woesearchaeota archaeon]